MSQFTHQHVLPRRIRLILVAVAAAFLAFSFRQALVTLLFQIALAALLAWAASPFSRRYEKRLPRGPSALLSLLTLVLLLVLLIYLLLPRLLEQLSRAAAALPQLLSLVQQGFDRLAALPFAQRFQITFASSEEILQRFGAAALSLLPNFLQKLAAFSNKVMRAFLSPALAFYFLRDREIFCFQCSLLIPLKHRKRALSALREMRREIAGYLRGQLLVSAAAGGLTALALFIIGVPAYLLLGACMGICDLIPYVGPFLGAVPIVLFSLPQGIYTVLWAIACVLLVQQIESLFLSPRLMGSATGLHPAYVLLLLSAGGMIARLPGMLLSLPLFVCLRGALRAFRCASQEESS